MKVNCHEKGDGSGGSRLSYLRFRRLGDSGCGSQKRVYIEDAVFIYIFLSILFRFLIFHMHTLVDANDSH